MTAVAARPAEGTGPAAGPGPTAPTQARGARRRSPLLPAAEVALTLLTLAVVLGFNRVFVDTSFLFPLAAVAVYSHGATAFTRRQGYGIGIAALLALPGLVLLSTALFFSGTAIAGVVPTGATLDAAQSAFSQSWSTFQNVVAPAPVETGFLLASVAAIFFAVFLADWAAFRLWSPLEAVVPASTLFVFCSLLGSEVHRLTAAGLYLAALLAFLLLHRGARQEHATGWLAADAERGSRAIVRSGAGLAAVALLAGLVVGPRLPGADSPAIISWRGPETGSGSRVTISPLVDIQDRLVDQADVEVFTVDADQRAYWRLTALDTFEGDIWRSGGKYAAVDGDLDANVPAGVTEADAEQTFRIEALAALWLPAAFQPRAIDSPDADVRYQPESSTLIVDTTRRDSDNITYTVRSSLPRFTVDQLRGASTDVPADMRTRYLQLPADFSTLAADTAREVTTGAATPYDRARALQDYFQGPDFTYDLEVPKGHGENAIDQFLRDKRGYCEQFAGTFAAMARSVGLPARVAVGFTPGDSDPTEPNRFRVRGEHAHAWPEVWLGQYGWVPFEPTPGRGAPGAEAWTGLPEQQDTSGPSTSPSTVETTVTTAATPSTTAPNGADPSTTLPPQLETREVPGGAGAETGWFGGLPPVARAGIFLTGLLLLAAAYAALVLWLKRDRLTHRRHQASDASSRVRVAWQESVEELEVLGTRPDPAETHEEFARRAGDRLPVNGPALVHLAHDADAAAYAPGLLTDDVAGRAAAVARSITDEVRTLSRPIDRWLHQLDPRPLLPHLGLAGRHRAESNKD